MLTDLLIEHGQQRSAPAAGSPLRTAQRSAADERSLLPGTRMLSSTRRTVDALHPEGPGTAAREDPLVALVAVVGCFGAGLRGDIAGKRLGVLRAELTADGLDPDALLDGFTDYAATVITELRGENEPVPVVEEPLVEVGADADDGVFDVGLHEEIAHEHSRKVNQLVKELATQPGVLSAHREDREVLLVRAPDWNAQQLEQWVLDWLQARIPELG
ncbi:hypothetical protein GMA12_04960 [Kocuria sediminis]|uniref:Uncharacterized protein n=1 Tax=Kocuria sediminis TaxID=1038857 RepID=A0A6N8GMK0_9MICC|nr:hypothetical protein [Kocuria sediminis]MUN62493.1 hypothetical protein [Kocuria sediminis]